MSLLVVSLFAFLCGSIPTGMLIARRQGISLREVGSGNTGATNVARSAGKRAGVLTLLGDAAKGLVPVVIVRTLGLGDVLLAASAVAAVLGHVFSPFLNFSGGKGVATGLGVFLGLAPYAILLALLFFLATFATSRIVSLASLVAATVTPALVFLLSYAGTHVFAAVLIAVLIVGRHHQNIIRLWNGGEPRFNL